MKRISVNDHLVTRVILYLFIVITTLLCKIVVTFRLN
jgi:hypothetical protein